MQAATGAGWHWQDLPDADWVAENQRSFRPFAVGPFWVHPSHVADGMPAGLLPLRIDAGMAFGTGTHATTRGCLEMLAIAGSARAPSTLVDVGCGSGILAIAMAKLWRRPVTGGDNDAEGGRGRARERRAERRRRTLPCSCRPTGLRAAALRARRALRPHRRQHPGRAAARARRVVRGGRATARPPAAERPAGRTGGAPAFGLWPTRFCLRAPHRPGDRWRLVAHPASEAAVKPAQSKRAGFRRPSTLTLTLRYT